MIAIFQRVTRASVTATAGETPPFLSGECGPGCLILLGVANDDTKHDAELLATKIARLRVFSDDNGKFNFSLSDTGGAALVVPNFTLLADCKHGNRPDFLEAAKPAVANTLYEYFCTLLEEGIGSDCVKRGVFGADMKIDLTGDGPVTIMLDSKNL